jgi:peptide/nickel transport system substrate-binding protein/oligopeptide transport system substrate-binding protein
LPGAGGTYLIDILGAADRLNGVTNTIIANGDDPRKGLDVIDARTLKIRLAKPISYFLQALTYSTADVVEKSFVQDPKYAGGLWVDHLDQGGTSGPFKLKSYGDGTTMTFVPNPYWEKAYGQQLTLTEVIRPVLAKVDLEYTNYKSGAFDYTDVPSSDYSIARGQGDFHSVPTLETDYFGLNFHQPPFDNLQVRQAFDLALNKQLMVDRVENGGAVPTNHIVPEGMPGFDAGLTNPAPDGTQSLTGNVPAALALLKQAQATCPPAGTFGAPDYCPFISGDAPQEIDIYTPEENPANVQIAQFASQEWSIALSLNVKIKLVSFQPTLVGLVTKPATQNPASIWEIAWIADYPDPQDWLTLQFKTGSGYNSEGISDPKLDALMTSADTEHDVAKRMQMYNQAEQEIVNQCAWIPYQQTKIYWQQRSYVHGFGFNSIGLMVDVNWPKVYIAQH